MSVRSSLQSAAGPSKTSNWENWENRGTRGCHDNGASTPLDCSRHPRSALVLAASHSCCGAPGTGQQAKKCRARPGQHWDAGWMAHTFFEAALAPARQVQVPVGGEKIGRYMPPALVFIFIHHRQHTSALAPALLHALLPFSPRQHQTNSSHDAARRRRRRSLSIYCCIQPYY